MKPFLLAAWLFAYGGDTATTHAALAAGGVERNPFLSQHAWVNDTVLGSEAAGGAYLLNRYWAKHPKWAAAVAIAGVSIETYATIHNIRTLQRQVR